MTSTLPTGPKRFAITASDRYMGVFQAFIDCGWEPVKLFTAPIDSHMASNQKVVELAQSRNIPIQLSRMGEHDMLGLKDLGCDLLVVASYQWKIGNWEKYLPRAVNFHPAPLPDYRGAYPLIQGLLDRRKQWAFTCHKVAPNFDSGDILAAEEFPISADECHESLDIKSQLASKRLATRVAKDLDALWDGARVQGAGNYVKLWTDADREIDFNASADSIGLQLRAFGNFECMASLNGMRYFVRRAVCWTEAHGYSPGTVVHIDGLHYVVACKDGYVTLLDWSLIPPGMKIYATFR